MSTETIATIWAGLIAFAVMAYVVLDGFDLGVGMLFAAERGAEDRDTMVNSIAPMWDGNETWLVLGGGGLFGVFPLAYAVIMPALYPTILGMLFGLIFRGVAFEFRFRAETVLGPQALGPVVLRRLDRRRALPGADARRPASRHPCRGPAICRRLVGLADPFHGPVRDRGGHRLCLAGRLLAGVAHGGLAAEPRPHPGAGARLGDDVALIVAVSLWTPFLNETFMHRWFGWPGILLTSPIPILIALIAVCFPRRAYPRASSDAVPLRAGGLRSLLRGPRHQPLSADDPAGHHDLAGRRATCEPIVRARRRFGADPADSDLLWLQLLGLSRKGAGRCALPLIEAAPAVFSSSSDGSAPFGWGGVLTVAGVASALRWIMHAL